MTEYSKPPKNRRSTGLAALAHLLQTLTSGQRILTPGSIAGGGRIFTVEKINVGAMPPAAEVPLSQLVICLAA